MRRTPENGSMWIQLPPPRVVEASALILRHANLDTTSALPPSRSPRCSPRKTRTTPVPSPLANKCFGKFFLLSLNSNHCHLCKAGTSSGHARNMDAAEMIWAWGRGASHKIPNLLIAVEGEKRSLQGGNLHMVR